MPKIKGYKILEEIGSGGVGKVYRAIQESMGREVAVKILSPKMTANPQFVEEFIREARASGQLNHPNIINVYDVGAEGRLYYYTMIYIEGRTLKDLIREKGALSVKDALQIGYQMTMALNEAHSKGIIHRDVKPANILIDPSGRALLADLGIATVVSDGKTDGGSGAIVGTPQYMSPEQASGVPIDARSDMYSLGATLYHALTGRMPVTGPTPRDIVKRVIEDPIDPPSSIRPTLPEAVDALIVRMMEKKPEKRFANDRELGIVIKKLQTGGGPHAVRTSQSRESNKGTKAQKSTAIKRGVRTVRTTPKAGAVNRRRKKSNPMTSIVWGALLLFSVIVAWQLFDTYVLKPDREKQAQAEHFNGEMLLAEELMRKHDYYRVLETIEPLKSSKTEEKMKLHDVQPNAHKAIAEYVQRDIEKYRLFVKENPKAINQQKLMIEQVLKRYAKSPTLLLWLKKRQKELNSKP